MYICDWKDEQLSPQGHKECVTFLLYKCNVNPEPTDRWQIFVSETRQVWYCLFSRWGFTPLSEAERGGHKQVETILKLWTARFVLLNTYSSSSVMVGLLEVQPNDRFSTTCWSQRLVFEDLNSSWISFEVKLQLVFIATSFEPCSQLIINPLGWRSFLQCVPQSHFVLQGVRQSHFFL